MGFSYFVSVGNAIDVSLWLQPIINMFILIIGIPLFLNRQPASVVKSGGRCLLVCGSCFLFTFLCQNMVALDYPALTAWLPLILLTPVMVVSLDQMKT